MGAGRGEPGQVGADRVVEAELPGVTQLHDRGGRERLRDRRDPIEGVGGRGRAGCRVGPAEALRPHDVLVVDDGDREAGPRPKGQLALDPGGEEVDGRADVRMVENRGRHGASFIIQSLSRRMHAASAHGRRGPAAVRGGRGRSGQGQGQGRCPQADRPRRRSSWASRRASSGVRRRAELVFFQAAAPIATALAAGQLDVGRPGLTAALYNIVLGGEKLWIVADKGREWPGYPLTGSSCRRSCWDAGLRSIEDLKGKRIGVTQLGSTFHYHLGNCSRSTASRWHDVKIVPLQAMPPPWRRAREAGRCHPAPPAVPGAPPWPTGFGKILAWAGDLYLWQIATVFYSDSFAQDRARAVAFMKGYVKASRYYFDAVLVQKDGRSRPARLTTRSWRSPRSTPARARGHPARASRSRTEAAGYWSPDIERQIEWWVTARLHEAALPLKSIVDTSFLEEAARALGSWSAAAASAQSCYHPGAIRQGPRRQPRRDRGPRHAHAAASWASRPSPSTPRPTALAPHVADRRRGVPHRPAAAARELPRRSTRSSTPRSATGARRHPPGLRLPLRERGLRRGLRGGRASPSSGRRPRRCAQMGDKTEARATVDGGRRAGRPGRQRAAGRRLPDGRGALRGAKRSASRSCIKAAAGGGGKGMRLVARRGRAGRARSTARARGEAARSATAPSTSRRRSSARATSRSRSSATRTATSSTSASATARSSGATRR